MKLTIAFLFLLGFLLGCQETTRLDTEDVFPDTVEMIWLVHPNMFGGQDNVLVSDLLLPTKEKLITVKSIENWWGGDWPRTPNKFDNDGHVTRDNLKSFHLLYNPAKTKMIICANTMTFDEAVQVIGGNPKTW